MSNAFIHFRRGIALLVSLTLLMVILRPASARAQRSVITSPGIRVGLSFGEKTSLLVGAEFSLLYSSSGVAPYFGGVVDLDLINFRQVRLHGGAEFLFAELGPSVYLGGDSTRSAFDLSFFFPLTGLLNGDSGVYAQYTYSWVRNARDKHFLLLSCKAYMPGIELPKFN